MSAKHLKFIDSLICLNCGKEPTHHHLLRVRREYLEAAKGWEGFAFPKVKSKGMGTKSDDKFTLPLCPVCHQMLHIDGNEKHFLKCIGVTEPEQLALFLYNNSGNREVCLKKIKEIRVLRNGL